MNMLWDARVALWDAGIDASLCQLVGNPHVDDSRNMLVREFMKTDADEFLFIDSDVVAHPQDIVRFVKKDRPVAAVLYPFKEEPIRFPYRMRLSDGIYSEEDGCFELENLPTGFLKIQRPVFEKLIPTQEEFWGTGEDPKKDPPIPILFERKFFTVDGERKRLGGDYAFSQKWKEAGGRVYVYPDIELGHIGRKLYKGTFGVHLCAENGIDHPDFVRAVQKLKRDAPDDQTFQILYKRQLNHWVAPPDMLAALWLGAKEVKNGAILETGSGLSTLIMGIAADLTGSKLHVLEHDYLWFKTTYAMLERHGVKNVVMHYAPITVWPDGTAWYEPQDNLPDQFDMALNDGPQGAIGRHGFYKFINGKLTCADLYVDDVGRQGYQNVLKLWCDRQGRKFHIFGEGKVRKWAVSPKPPVSIGDTLSAA